MKIDISHVAKLADLPLTEEEEEKYTEQLSKVLEYVEQLNSIDTSGVEATFNVSGQENVMAEGVSEVCLAQEEALANAPKKQDGLPARLAAKRAGQAGFFITKGVFNNE